MGCGQSVQDDKAYNLRSRAVIAQREPYGVEVKAGETYYFCTCGKSKNQPWCDGSHTAYNEETGLDFQPLKYVPAESGKKFFCGCKKTRTAPLCDGSHLGLPPEKKKDQADVPAIAVNDKIDESAYGLQSRSLVAKRGPYGVEVKAGKTYYFCTCGGSKNQPWCDGSHVKVNEKLQTTFQPMPYTPEESTTLYMCGCKKSKALPLCDGTHAKLPKDAVERSKQDCPLDDNAYDLQTKALVTQRGPYGVEVKAGETYYFCTCGASKNQPWCDGSHNEFNERHGTNIQPMPYTAHESGKKFFCGCKQSKTLPLCDGSHESLPKDAVEKSKLEADVLAAKIAAGGAQPMDDDEDDARAHQPAAEPKPESASPDTMTAEQAFDLRTKAVIAKRGPYGVDVIAGKTYYFCTCGASKNQPWCDGSHVKVNTERGTDFAPMQYIAKDGGTEFFCGCKQSGTLPLCDGTHNRITPQQEKDSQLAPAVDAAAVDSGAPKTCVYCEKPIEAGAYLTSGDSALHKECLEGYTAKIAGNCKHCEKPLTGEYMEFKSEAGDAARLHPECAEAYKASTRPPCDECGEKILDDKYMTLDGKKYHEKCAPKSGKAPEDPPADDELPVTGDVPDDEPLQE